MRVLVPFDTQSPKTRLAPALDAAERELFAKRMLADVLAAIDATPHDPLVLATGPVETTTPVTQDERPLTAAVNAALADADKPVGVVMADLALVTPAALDRLFGLADGAEVVIAPGIGGGTNALVVDQPGFRVDYHGLSYRDHRRRAEELGATAAVVDSYRLSVDIDRPADLREVLLHADGSAAGWLEAAGFE
ncbi:MAG: 2-phospho-L-lactate guanylyltransferase, partial [halophilic archaeon J07HX5]